MLIYSRFFRFINTSMLVRKTWGALHIKNIFCHISIISQSRQDSEVQNRMIFRDRDASFVNSVTETPGAI